VIRDGDQSESAEARRPIALVAEDNARLASFLNRALAAAGYRVEHALNGVHALDCFERLAPDVVLVDLQVFQARELTRQLRASSDVPIVLLSTTDSVEERVAGLDAGADDYITIPFAVEELLARLRALRRGRALASANAAARARHGILTYADVQLDLDSREVSRGDRKIELRHKAFELLAHFMRHPERVLTRRELLEDVWGFEFLGDSNVIEVTVSHIRQALEADGQPRLIYTVRPVGYILKKQTCQSAVKAPSPAE
jgi:DNA-binding response OmpR family regulator